MLNYRATPHCTTGIVPSELLFNRKIQTKLPQIEIDTTLPDTHPNIEERDKQAKEKMKEHADRRVRAYVSDLKIGETILLRQRKKNKFSTTFDQSPFLVTKKKRNDDHSHQEWKICHSQHISVLEDWSRCCWTR